MKPNPMKLLLLTALLIAGLFLAGCDTYDNFLAEFFQKGEDKPPTVKIGVFEPLTGADAAGAAMEVQGIQLAHELFPTVLGYPVELVYEDNQSDVKEAVLAAQRLVDKEVSVVLGSYKSVLTLAGSDIFEEAGIPAIGITCTNPIITKTNDYYSRVCYVDAFQGNTAAKYVTEHLKRETAVAFQMRGDDYAGAMVEQFVDKMSQATENPDAVTVVEYPDSTKDFKGFFERFLTTGNDVIFFPSDAEKADGILRQAAEEGYRFNWIGSEKWERFLELYPEESKNGTPDRRDTHLEGLAYITGFDAEAELSDMTRTFLRAYQAKYGEEALPCNRVALGFDAYLLAIKAIEEAGSFSQGSRIAGKISSTYEMAGATGSITLNAIGDPIKEVVVDRIVGGKPKPVFTSVPVWGQ